MLIEPKPGLVIRYDFLWKEESDTNNTQGYKDRPCAIILTTKPKTDNSIDVVLCPITHSSPQSNETAVAIPRKVAQHLNLDNEQSWIKTHQVNVQNWQPGRIPYGVSIAYDDKWSFGILPRVLGKQAFDQVRENAHKQSLQTTNRDNK